MEERTLRKMKKRIEQACTEAGMRLFYMKAKLKEKRGEGYVDTAIKILIAVVLGALLLAGLYALFNDTVSLHKIKYCYILLANSLLI